MIHVAPLFLHSEDDLFYFFLVGTVSRIRRGGMFMLTGLTLLLLAKASTFFYGMISLSHVVRGTNRFIGNTRSIRTIVRSRFDRHGDVGYMGILRLLRLVRWSFVSVFLVWICILVLCCVSNFWVRNGRCNGNESLFLCWFHS